VRELFLLQNCYSAVLVMDPIDTRAEMLSPTLFPGSLISARARVVAMVGAPKGVDQ
jgi:hypothetical protein